MSTSFLTEEGYQKLQEELDYLREEKRIEIAERLREAMEGGDLVDNAEYEAAKREQAFVEGRLKEVQYLLATARVIDDSTKSNDVVDIGSTVTIKEEGSKKEVYMIVGPAEANPGEGRISNESPFGQALLGNSVGDVVEIKAPEGSFEIKILKVA